RIKPLREVMTEDVILYDKIRKIPYIPGRCPHAKDNIRLSVQNILNELEEKYPGTKYQIVRFYDTIQPLIVKNIKIEKEFKYCKICGEPSSTEICRVCQLLKKIERYDSKSHSSAE
ncbi:MAG: TIGR00269 family protein, partial [Candidatus Aenigmarchaeota archaeon]|nr:TIGR00269 family protein [Candidatus Aenigmarchaeota archaeon]